jgi:hypothetical protein
MAGPYSFVLSVHKNHVNLYKYRVFTLRRLFGFLCSPLVAVLLHW